MIYYSKVALQLAFMIVKMFIVLDTVVEIWESESFGKTRSLHTGKSCEQLWTFCTVCVCVSYLNHSFGMGILS